MLKKRAFNATLWSGTDVFLRQGAQFFIAIVLARLLSPAEFGTFGLLLLFAGIAAVFVDGGFSAALIQRQDVDQADESTVFWFNLLMGFVAALAMCLIAPAVAAFYGRPILVPLMMAMAANVFLGALGAIHSSLLSKRLDFLTQMKVGVVAVVSSGGIAIWMAWSGYGVWTLAIQTVVMTTVSTALLWLLNRWRPTLQFSAVSIRKLFGFGGYHFASILMEMAYSKLYTILIGKFHGVSDVGYYTNADTTQQMPSGVLIKILSRVVFPMFSTASDDKARLRRGMQLAIRGVMLLNVPMMLGMAVAAEPLVQVVFGAQWLPAVPILRVLCIAGVLLPMHSLNLNCLMAQGHSRLMFRLELTKKVIGVIALGIGACFGVMGIAWSMVAFSIIGLAINAHYTKRFLDYGVVAQTRDFLPVLVAGILMAAAVQVVSSMWQASPVIKLVGLVAAGVAVFGGVVVAARLDALHDVVALFKGASAKASGNGVQP